MKNVLIMLSTYNGEKYLREQINSLLHQTGVKTTILVRDDGSKDSTLSILYEYSKTSDIITIIEGDNKGVVRSFMELMNEALKMQEKFDYYCFCDQDDVWMEDKLSSAISILDKVMNCNEGRPLLYMGAYQMVDVNLNPIDTPIKSPTLTLEGVMSSNCATGCTMVFNHQLLKMGAGVDVNDILMHDYWLCLVCILFDGYVFYDKEPHIFYRQHGNNVVGGKKDTFINRWGIRLSKLFRSGDHYKSHLASKLLACFGNEIDVNKRRFLEDIANVDKFRSKYHLLTNDKFLKGTIDKKIQLIGLIVTGKL